MRDAFRGYYPPSSQEFDELWSDALIVPDANVLLNFHRLSETPRSSFVELFSAFESRLWVPYQAAAEYQRNRINVKWQQRRVFQSLQDNITQFRNTITTTANSQQPHAILDRDELSRRVTRALRSLNRYIAVQETAYNAQFANDGAEDSIHEVLTRLLDGRVGEMYSDERITQIRLDGEDRYDHQIPPGYADKNKQKVTIPMPMLLEILFCGFKY